MKHLCLETDILIIGGGLTGASLLLALKNSGYRALLVEAKDFHVEKATPLDTRTLALAPASKNILQMLDIWARLHDQINPIETIHVSEQFGFGSSRLHSKINQPLGYVVEMQVINTALHQLLDTTSVLAPAQFIEVDEALKYAYVKKDGATYRIQFQLIVAADGMNSSVRKYSSLALQVKDYQQVAIVANISLARPHQHIAYERFTADGPLALLPMTGQRAALIWSTHPQKAESLIQADEKIFLQQLQKIFGYKLGRFIQVGKRQIYPLKQAIMPKQSSWPFVFIGNAAHNLHPVAGQGFNLGLRDIATLAQCIQKLGLNSSMLAEYDRMRQYDQKTIATFCDSLISVFSNQQPLLKHFRRLGLIAMDNLPFLQRLLKHHAGGFSGAVADLVCGIPLAIGEEP